MIGACKESFFSHKSMSYRSISDTNIKLLLHLNNTSCTDYSSFNKSPTIGGTIALANARPSGFPGSANSIRLTGSLSDAISFANSTDWNMVGVDGSIDFWVYPTTLDADGALLLGQSNSNGVTADHNWYLYCYKNGAVGIGISGESERATAAGAIAINGWYHIAIAKGSGGGIYIYVNGVSRALSSVGSGVPFNTSSNPLYIGASAQSKFKGYITEVRWSRGVNQYAGYAGGNFTIPTSPYGLSY